jgi:allantoinase
MAGLPSDYPRDLTGYGRRLPDPKWPGGARIAVQIALNLEAGSELNLLHGDDRSEELLTDTGFPAVLNARSVLVESAFEYGSRRGVWRVLTVLLDR